MPANSHAIAIVDIGCELYCPLHPFHRWNILFTALFTNMRIVKFKSHLTIAFFAAVNHLSGPLRKQNFTLTGSKGHGL